MQSVELKLAKYYLYLLKVRKEYHLFQSKKKHYISKVIGDWRLGGPPFRWDIPNIIHACWEIPTGGHKPYYGMFVNFLEQLT